MPAPLQYSWFSLLTQGKPFMDMVLEAEGTIVATQRVENWNNNLIQYMEYKKLMETFY